MKCLISLCFLISSSSFAMADQQRSIEVMTESSVSVVPDQVLLGLELVIRSETMLKAKQKSDEALKVIVAAAKNQKISADHVRIRNMRVSPKRDSSISFGMSSNKKPVPVEISRTIEIQLNDLNQLPPMLTSVLKRA